MDAESPEGTERPTIGKVFRDATHELGQTLVAFVKAPKALWGINIPYVLEGLAYFGILTILGKFCSENVALSDLHAGWVYSAVTGGITFAMLLFGGVSDKIGVGRSLALAFLMFVIGRGLVAFSGTAELGQGLGSPMFYVMAAGLFLMVTAYGLYQPASYAGVKRYTTTQTAAMGYAVIYGLMNLGAFLSGFLSPLVRHMTESTFPPNGLAGVFWAYTALSLIGLVITMTILTRKTDEAAVASVAVENARLLEASGNAESTDQNDDTTAAADDEHINNTPFFALLAVTAVAVVLAIFGRSSFGLPVSSLVLWIGASVVGLATLVEYVRHRPDHPFRDSRFVFFIFILIPVQTLFAHNWLTIPYYLDRAFAGSYVSNYFELFSNINPILIFVLAPLVAGLTARANIYKMMIIGTLVMAAPTFLLAIGPNVSLFLLYILLMSIGEAMWQPRFLQWVAEIAPEGKTGMYMGIGQFPWFLTKFGTGLYSGYFIERYIPHPDTGLPTQSGTLWFLYALIAMISPVALILARKWMVRGMKERHEG